MVSIVFYLEIVENTDVSGPLDIGARILAGSKVLVCLYNHIRNPKVWDQLCV